MKEEEFTIKPMKKQEILDEIEILNDEYSSFRKKILNRFLFLWDNFNNDNLDLDYYVCHEDKRIICDFLIMAQRSEGRFRSKSYCPSCQFLLFDNNHCYKCLTDTRKFSCKFCSYEFGSYGPFLKTCPECYEDLE